MQTWLTSWWGWSRGSVRDRLRELELRGRDCRLEIAPAVPLGYRSEAERSKGVEPLCCWNRIAAARACSRIIASSYLVLFVDEDRTLDHRALPELVPAWLGRRFTGRIFFLTGSGKRQAQRLPIEAWVACRKDGRNELSHKCIVLLLMWTVNCEAEKREKRRIFLEKESKKLQKKSWQRGGSQVKAVKLQGGKRECRKDLFDCRFFLTEPQPVICQLFPPPSNQLLNNG